MRLLRRGGVHSFVCCSVPSRTMHHHVQTCFSLHLHLPSPPALCRRRLPLLGASARSTRFGALAAKRAEAQRSFFRAGGAPQRMVMEKEGREGGGVQGWLLFFLPPPAAVQPESWRASWLAGCLPGATTPAVCHAR